MCVSPLPDLECLAYFRQVSEQMEGDKHCPCLRVGRRDGCSHEDTTVCQRLTHEEAQLLVIHQCPESAALSATDVLLLVCHTALS